MSIGKKIGLFAGPIAFLLILLIPAPEPLSPAAWKVIATAVFMLIWWVTEAVPIPVAALLPIVCFPFLGVSTTKEAAAPYGSDMVFLFMGGFMLALAMERWSLHRRIALNIVRLTGTSANGILLGFMLSTMLLSMWISNTATTVLMLPIAMSVIHLIAKQVDHQTPGFKRFALSLMLGIAYSANVGGTATIIGTPPNVVMRGVLEETYNMEISFATWMALGVPFAVLMLAIVYLLLVYVLYPNRLGKFEAAKSLIDREIKDLGPMQKAEIRVLVVFLFTAFAWILRGPVDKWLDFMIIKDAGIAILAAVLLFIVPVNFKKGEFLLEWRNTEKLPWGILLLFGGGLSLAAALNKTGLIQLVGDQFAGTEMTLLILMFTLT
ncbi:MAG: DASS family sodium-coupled anion symporter, partial [Bacteroidota bacterium]